jgi:hypothetical protein
MKTTAITLSLLGLLLLLSANDCLALDLVRDGKPVATIIADNPPPGKTTSSSDMEAARMLVSWIAKITDVQLPIAQAAPAGMPAIYVGTAAVKAGLNLDDIHNPTNEGLRINSDGNHVLLAGQNDTATMKAACRFLEELGCRYFMDNSLGEVYPRTKTLIVGKLNITEQPQLLMRRTWGSSWGNNSLWKTWNGAGGTQFRAGHAWSGYVSAAVFEKHPEWFALRNGQRYNNGWLCTSNPELRRYFADQIIAAVEAVREQFAVGVLFHYLQEIPFMENNSMGIIIDKFVPALFIINDLQH